MGAMQNNGDQKKSNTKGRGKARNKDRLAAFASDNADGHADWGSCNADLVWAVVKAITAMGGAVIFGLSRDMGAHSLTLMLDGQRKVLWFNGDADLNEEVRSVLVTLEEMAT